MAASMILKFDKYWDEISGVMAIGIVLDPRYKIDLLDYFFLRYMVINLIVKLKR